MSKQNSNQDSQIQGLWKNITITDNDIEQAKKSVFRAVKQW